MKILSIMQGTDLGGTEQVALRLMVEMKNGGHQVRAVSLNKLGRMSSILKQNKIEAEGVVYSGLYGWRAILSIRSLINKEKCDMTIMTGHHFLTMLLLNSRNKNSNILMQHFHHTNVKKLWQWKLIYWVASKKFGEITFPSRFLLDEAVSIYPPIKKISKVFYNPLVNPIVKSQDTRCNRRERLGFKKDSLVIGNAGWLIARKRFDVFIDVAKEISKKIPNVQFLIAGDGPLRSYLLERARSADCDIIFSGWINDMTDFYHIVDIVLFNSDIDAMGMTAIDAINNEIPIVASVIKGGLTELIDPEDKFIFYEHNIQLLCSSLISLINDDMLRKSNALRAKHYLLEKVKESTARNLIATVERNLLNIESRGY